MAVINGTNFNDNNTVQFNGAFDEFFPSLEGTLENDDIFGFNGTDILNGSDGNDTLNGGAGADEMNGGDQDDTYFVDNVGDVAAETFNDATGGVDTVNSTVSHTLGFGIEHLTLTGGGAINGTGNENNNIIFGNLAANFINGGTGADFMDAGDGSDIYVVDNLGDFAAESFNDFAGGVDTVNSSVSHGLGFGIEHLTLTGGGAINGTGNENNNILFGNQAANFIDGGTGADTMNAGDDSDTYVVDNVGDVAAESFNDAAGGVDRVNSSVSHTLGFGIEELFLTGGGAINGTGNGNDNFIIGNAAANVLNGGSGGDNLSGGGGNDNLNGGAGIDGMAGGSGNDTYTVDNASDTVTEAGGAGTDLVNASISYTLVANVENLTLTGAAAINGTGNTLNNTILGNNAANTLAGGGGNDTLHGNAGNDTLNGGSGADTLLGLTGTDSLIGGTGFDLFRFTAIGQSVVGAGRDTIAGFDAVGGALQDRVDVNVIDANTAAAGNQNFSFISTAAFSAAGQIRVFNSGGNTIVQGNVNGNLAADFEVLVQDGGAVAANWVAGDFFL